ncbi:MAG: DUF4330 family protein [Clostridia bacterium]|nr:DUF4330 family protein [Clostridia bacterium]
MTANENSVRKKIRISIIDVIIVITVLACIAGGVLHYRVYENNNKVITDDVFYVSMRFSSIENSSGQKIETGDSLYLNDGKVLLGTVNEVTEEDASFYYNDEVTGELKKGKDPGAKDISVVVEIKGELTKENGFLANGVKYVAAGMILDVYSDMFSAKGLIFDLEAKTE